MGDLPKHYPKQSKLMVYLPTWIPYKSTIHVGKYTMPLDPKKV